MIIAALLESTLKGRVCLLSRETMHTSHNSLSKPVNSGFSSTARISGIGWTREQIQMASKQNHYRLKVQKGDSSLYHQKPKMSFWSRLGSLGSLQRGVISPTCLSLRPKRGANLKRRQLHIHHPLRHHNTLMSNYVNGFSNNRSRF